MNFIESIFHVAPDGGSGSLELAILIVVLIFPLAVFAVRRKRVRF